MTVLAPTTATEPSWLLDVRLRAQRHMLFCRELWAGHHHLGEEAMAISHGEADLALASRSQLLAAELEFQRNDEQAQELSAEIEELAQQACDERWEQLCAALELTACERELLSLALAAELAPALRRVYGYLQDETVALDPTPALAAELWGRAQPPRIHANGALLRWALAQPRDANAEPSSSTTGWVADPLLLEHLLEGDQTRSAPLGRPVAPATGP
jgi:hypothetical protein